MTLADALNNVGPRQTKSCVFGAWVATLPEDDRNAITAAFDNREISTLHIYRTLDSVGSPSSYSTINTHRQNGCKSCRREVD